MNSYCFVVFLAVLGAALAFTGQYIPKSFYVIDQNGHKSETIYLRSKRAADLYPLLRSRRGGGSFASSSASASASSSSSSGGPGHLGIGGPGFAPGYSQGGYNNAEQGFNNHPGFNSFGPGTTLFSRFGEEGPGIHASGSSDGAKGVYSGSSSSIDADGNVKYSVHSGKF